MIQRISFASLCLCVALAPLAARAEGERGGEFGFVGGVLAQDEDMTGDEGTIYPIIGVRGGSLFAHRWGWFIDGLHSKTSSSLALGDVRTISGHSAFEYRFRPDRPTQWFVTAGGGWMVSDFEDSSSQDFHRPLALLGLGQRVSTGERKHVRWELRVINTLDDARLGGADLIQGHFLLTFTWGPGTSGRSTSAPPTPQPTSKPQASPAPLPPPTPKDQDQDGDAVRDSRDRCPATPAGARVDEQGCPLDGDRDGVPDGIDRCPGSLRGEPVSADGCAKDSDRDGVREASDACPATPEGAVVDEWGCPRDTDGDGVLDGIDRCPQSSPGAAVDATGCP